MSSTGAVVNAISHKITVHFDTFPNFGQIPPGIYVTLSYNFPHLRAKWPSMEYSNMDKEVFSQLPIRPKYLLDSNSG